MAVTGPEICKRQEPLMETRESMTWPDVLSQEAKIRETIDKNGETVGGVVPECFADMA